MNTSYYKQLFVFMLTSVAASVMPMCKVQAQGVDQRMHRLDELVVTARRPMKEIGVQKTALDSIALKENIALSMADILTFNSSVFVKNYGRATLSTVAFRGTSPSHTQVMWNGLRINSPMLGMTDFSTIPSYFIDKAVLLHGTSSVNETGGGIGGLVSLGTNPDVPDGFAAQYVQGIGSFSTFDEFLRLSFSDGHWTVSTRAVYSSSPNDFKYVNHDKKLNIYDDNHNIIGQYHPVERNGSASFKDLHLLQEIYYNTHKGNRYGLNVWYVNSNRELPMISTDYGDASEFENRQRENTLRAVASWDHNRENWRMNAKAGYVYTWMAYDYRREVAVGNWSSMTRSRSNVNTLFGHINSEMNVSEKWYFTANVSAHQQMVRSIDRKVIVQADGRAIVGYDKSRLELSASASAKWQPSDRIGMSMTLRQDIYGDDRAPLIPAFFIDGLLSRRGNVMLRASVSSNYRFPSLNDLYFQPGGNPDLKSERGVSYDAGASFSIGKTGSYSIGGSLTWFDSYIDDWIIWLPTTKGFFSPRNVKRVHAYGLEAKADFSLRIHKDLMLDFNSSYSWTPSVNDGEKMSAADKSVGMQLPYVPRHSASFTARLSWRSWSFLYKWCFYSERYTMSSNDHTITGHLPKYYMNNVSLEKLFRFRPVDLSLKLAVNNLFDEDYLSVLSRPMPGINFEIFIGITPKFTKKKVEKDEVY